MDFVHDNLFNGRRIRFLTVVDNLSRTCLALLCGQSLKGTDVVAQMEQIVAQRAAYPERIQVDNGSEFISKALDKWAYENEVTLDFSRPGKPTDNPFIESFNGSFRDECLNVHWFLSIDDAQKKADIWKDDYNGFRPHSSIGNKTPNEFESFLDKENNSFDSVKVIIKDEQSRHSARSSTLTKSTENIDWSSTNNSSQSDYSNKEKIPDFQTLDLS